MYNLFNSSNSLCLQIQTMKNLYFILLFLVLNGCKKSEDGKVEVVPLAPSELTVTLISNNQVDLTWKDNSTNEIGYKIERKTDSGDFMEIGATAQDITTYSDKTLSLNTKYTYRVYSFNQVGKSLSYSNEFVIQTIGLPILTTTEVSNITSNGASSGGKISSDGGSAITNKGIVWGTSSNPDISLPTKTSNGTGTGIFVGDILNLDGNTTYYLRAYATNAAGTAYGAEISFKTLKIDINRGLIACYPFNGNAKNLVDTSNDGIVKDAILVMDRFNNANAAYSFNGTSSFIDFGTNPNIGPTTMIPITISLWIKPNGTGGNVISKYTNLDANRSFFYFGRNDNSLSWIGRGTNPYITKSQTTDTEWTHYVLIASSNVAKVYRNGQLLTSGVLAINSTMRDVPLIIGKVSGTSPGFYKGLVDDVFIYNRVLSENEIPELYNHRF